MQCRALQQQAILIVRRCLAATEIRGKSARAPVWIIPMHRRMEYIAMTIQPLWSDADAIALPLCTAVAVLSAVSGGRLAGSFTPSIRARLLTHSSVQSVALDEVIGRLNIAGDKYRQLVSRVRRVTPRRYPWICTNTRTRRPRTNRTNTVRRLVSRCTM